MYRRCVLGLCLFVLFSCQPAEEEDNEDRRQFNTGCIEKGDILFRRGDSLSSRAVLSTDTKGEYSHIGIAVNHSGSIMVAHAIPGEDKHEYIRIDSIEDFFDHSRASSGAICRVAIDSTQKNRINDYAVHLATSKIPFDHDYDTEHQNTLYCTEYIWVIFKTIGLDLSCGKRYSANMIFIQSDIILPSHIFQHPQLQVISQF